jgi:protein SCO1
MKKYRPFFILFLILILPLVVYVMMKLGTKQNYKPIEIISEKIQNPDGSPDSVYQAVGNFAFVSQTGDTLTLDSLKGKIWVANLFYGKCTDVCDVDHGYIQQMLGKDFVDDPNVRFVSFSVNGEEDSLAVLKAYAKRMEAKPGRWYFVSGNGNAVRKYLEEQLQYPTIDKGMVGTNQLNDRTFRLVDWNGLLRGQFYNAELEPEMVTLAQHVVLLQKEKVDSSSVKAPSQP